MLCNEVGTSKAQSNKETIKIPELFKSVGIPYLPGTHGLPSTLGSSTLNNSSKTNTQLDLHWQLSILMVNIDMVSTTRKEKPSSTPAYSLPLQKENTFTWTVLGWATCSQRNPPKFGNKRLTSLSMHRESSKAEYQALQLMTRGIISHCPYGLFFIFKLQASTINLSARYTAKSIKWKSQTKSFEEFLGLFRYSHLSHWSLLWICCIFNSLHQQNTTTCNLETILSYSPKLVKFVSPTPPCSQQHKQVGSEGNSCLHCHRQSTGTPAANPFFSSWAVWRDISHPRVSLTRTTFIWLNITLSPELTYSMIRCLQTP